MASSSFGQCSGGSLKGPFDHCRPSPAFGIDRNLDATDRSSKSAPSREAFRVLGTCRVGMARNGSAGDERFTSEKRFSQSSCGYGPKAVGKLFQKNAMTLI